MTAIGPEPMAQQPDLDTLLDRAMDAARRTGAE